MKTIAMPGSNISVLDEADVIVVGGGLSGVAAAATSARSGAKTLLVERNGILGGVATAGLMSSMCHWFLSATGKLILRGIALELVQKLTELGATTSDWKQVDLPQLPFDQEMFRYLLVDMVQEAGIKVLLHTFMSEVLVEGRKIEAIITESKSGRTALLGKEVVDATGDADIIARAGAPFNYTPPGSNSLEFLMDDVDIQKTYEFFKQNRKKWKLIENQDVPTTYEEFERNWLKRGMFHLPHGGGGIEGSPLWILVQKAVESGDYARNKGNCVRLDAFGFFGLRTNRTMVVNTGFFENIDELDVVELSRAEMEARSLIPYVANFLRKCVPGFESAKVIASASDLGVRVTRWIEGEYTLTVEDQVGEARFQDTVGALPLTRTWSTFVVPRKLLQEKGILPHLREGERYFEVPYRCMVPRKLDNVIVASGKSVSTDPRALLRGQPACLLLGQAAGAAASLAAQEGTSFRHLDMSTLQRHLLEQDVWLGDENRLAQLGLT